MSANKSLPNIIICGTPGRHSTISSCSSRIGSILLGVGKSRLCQELCAANESLTHININDLAKQKNFLLEYDEDNECHILDDDAIQDYLDEEYLQKSPSGLVIEYHQAGIVPESDHIHGVFVVRCSNEKLYDRYKQREYSTEKIDQNIQSEIFQVCLDEARESFDENIVHELTNETEEDLKKNLQHLRTWIKQWPLNTETGEKK